jgi:hypothetical protein
MGVLTYLPEYGACSGVFGLERESEKNSGWACFIYVFVCNLITFSKNVREYYRRKVS